MTVFTVKQAVAILIKGCDKHPEYRAKEEPDPLDGGCGGCSKVWKAMEDLKTIQGGR